MKRQTIIALCVALVLGLVAVFLANSFLIGTQQRADLAGRTKVAVAAVPLAYGTEITPDKIRFAEFPNSSLPAGSFTSLASLLPAGKRRAALLPIQVNEPILAGKISGEGKGASIAALLPDGKRAAAVRINDVSGVAGFVQPNDSVDVLVTRSIVGQNNSNQQLTDVLLQDARVIAIDQDAQGADGKPAVARTATLEVSPLDAQKLALGQQVGSLSLVLRKPGDDQNSPVVQTVSLNDLRFNRFGNPLASANAMSLAATTIRAPAPVHIARRTVTRSTKPAPPRKKTDSVEVVRGTKGDSYEVGGHGV
jgi:pilus assembly protein CpaB